MFSTPVHIKDENELKIIVPFVFHFNLNKVLLKWQNLHG